MKIIIHTILSFLIIAISSCSYIKRNVVEPSNVIIDTVDTEKAKDITETKPLIGDSIYGDFNGDGVFEYAYVALVKEATGGSPIDGSGTPAEYAIKFSNDSITVFPTGCCGMTLINEGDLNGNKTDEISIFQSPMNGCSYDWRTITYRNNAWQDLIEPSLLPSIGCDGILPKEELQDIVTLEDNVVYRKVVDINDETSFYKFIEDENGKRFDFGQLKKEKQLLK